MAFHHAANASPIGMPGADESKRRFLQSLGLGGEPGAERGARPSSSPRDGVALSSRTNDSVGSGPDAAPARAIGFEVSRGAPPRSSANGDRAPGDDATGDEAPPPSTHIEANEDAGKPCPPHQPDRSASFPASGEEDADGQPSAGEDGPDAGPLQLACPECGRQLALRREHVGVEGSCVWCGLPMVAAHASLDGEIRIFPLSRSGRIEPAPASLAGDLDEHPDPGIATPDRETEAVDTTVGNGTNAGPADPASDDSAPASGGDFPGMGGFAPEPTEGTAEPEDTDSSAIDGWIGGADASPWTAGEAGEGGSPWNGGGAVSNTSPGSDEGAATSASPWNFPPALGTEGDSFPSFGDGPGEPAPADATPAPGENWNAPWGDSPPLTPLHSSGQPEAEPEEGPRTNEGASPAQDTSPPMTFAGNVPPPAGTLFFSGSTPAATPSPGAGESTDPPSLPDRPQSSEGDASRGEPTSPPGTFPAPDQSDSPAPNVTSQPLDTRKPDERSRKGMTLLLVVLGGFVCGVALASFVLPVDEYVEAARNLVETTFDPPAPSAPAVPDTAPSNATGSNAPVPPAAQVE